MIDRGVNFFFYLMLIILIYLISRYFYRIYRFSALVLSLCLSYIIYSILFDQGKIDIESICTYDMLENILFYVTILLVVFYTFLNILRDTKR